VRRFCTSSPSALTGSISTLRTRDRDEPIPRSQNDVSQLLGPQNRRGDVVGYRAIGCALRFGFGSQPSFVTFSKAAPTSSKTLRRIPITNSLAPVSRERCLSKCGPEWPLKAQAVGTRPAYLGALPSRPRCMYATFHDQLRHRGAMPSLASL